MIRQKDIRVMAVNVPTTWINSGMSEFDSRLFAAINDMLLDMLALLPEGTMNNDGNARKQGIEKARKDGKYKGRKPNQARYDAINRLIESGSSWSQVQKVPGCSRGTISSAIKT
ncbi:resolvase domain-containing protein [Escherichia coli]|uniref:Resolvase domain-containing protein n=1 Tax=Escherichia coli TaxID=562 RepID=A0A376ZW21_ECOLX|nr:resolvase domain-containing protein [Escherichia coli]